MGKHKLPWNELSGESNLNGTYRVTFLINIKEEDELSIADVHESIASGFAGDSVLHKIANLDLEKTSSDGTPLAERRPFVVGDRVVITEDIELEAEIGDLQGYTVIGSKLDHMEKSGTVKVKLPQGLTAEINSIDGDTVELVDFESAINLPLQSEAGETQEILANIDNVIFSNTYIDHLEGESD